MKKTAKLFIVASTLLVFSQTANSIAFTDCNTLLPNNIFTASYMPPAQEVVKNIVGTVAKELLNLK